MRIKANKQSKPKRLKLRKTPNLARLATDATEKPQTTLMRFLAVPALDFKFLSDHLKNYFTVAGFCALAVYLISKGTAYDKHAPWLGATLGVLILCGALAFAGLNSVQMMEALNRAGKGRGWKALYVSLVVFMAFVLSAVITHATDKV